MRLTPDPLVFFKWQIKLMPTNIVGLQCVQRILQARPLLRDHPWGIPKQDDSVLGAVWCPTFPAKSALETKIRSPISRKHLVVST